MTPLYRLVFWFCCSLSTRCMVAQTVSWPSVVTEDKGFNNMLLINDGKQLIISGLNGIYNLNTTDFQLLNRDVTNDVIRIMIYNETETPGNAVITTCSSTRDYCDIRDIGDISRSVHHLQPSIKVDGVAAVMARGNNRKQEFLFVGCPHVEDQELLNGRCTQPGIAWYLNSGISKSNTWYGFKSYGDTPVLTNKYIDAFNVDKFRIFFSLQIIKASSQIKSRIAQVCQYISHWNNKYTTPYTYADMPVQCGELNVILAVKQVTFAAKVVFIAVFSERGKSAVCVYTMEDIKKMFVANIKTCYNGSRPDPEEDYINFKTSESFPCTTATSGNDTLHKPDDYYLCNEDYLQKFSHIIGNQPLHTQPSIQYNSSLTAVSVTVQDSKIIAFLGTANGDILKAVVHPQKSATFIKQPRTHNVGYGIKKDMYTSKNEKNIFVLTQRQVFKEPVELCSGFSTCEDCIGSKDPYCGWCSLKFRCSNRDKCAVADWISASGDGRCPHVVKISPEVMSDKEIVELDILVSQALHGVVVTCIFHSVEVADFRDTVQATVSDNGTRIACRPKNILTIINKIKGFLVVTVSIAINVSDTSIMSGHFIMYYCDSFDRCSGCTAKNWTCKWCLYSSQCIDSYRDCGTTDPHNNLLMDIEVPYDSCPQVTNYSLLSDGNSLRDSAGTIHLSRDQNYQINITGTNLPAPRTGSVSYKCKIVVSRTQTLWFNDTVFDESGSFTCRIQTEEMSTLPETLSRQEVNVQVMWGRSIVDGDTLPVIIYKCENLVQPKINCGQCKSFAIYQQYIHCQWCETSCIDSGKTCNSTSSDCLDPTITTVYPQSAYMNATTVIEIEGFNLGSVYNDTINAVTVAGIQCASIESSYDPGIKIVCELAPSYRVLEGSVSVKIGNNATGHYSDPFHFKNPVVTSIEPNLGPMSGGTNVTIYGENLDAGRDKNVTIGGKICLLFKPESTYKISKRYNDSHVILLKEPQQLVCRTSSSSGDLNVPLEVKVDFDGADVTVETNITYKYVMDPNITEVHPKESFQSGGRKLTIHGTDLYGIQRPLIYSVIDDRKMKSEACERDDVLGVIYCPSPAYRASKKRRKRNTGPVRAILGFEMDDVSSVTSDNLSDDLAVLMYFPDPVLENFTEVKLYKELQERLIIRGQRLKVAADEDDVLIKIGCEKCNVTSLTNDTIICEPPVQKPACAGPTEHRLNVKVNIGFLQRNVGVIEYKVPDLPQDKVTRVEYIFAGSVVGFLVLCLLAAFIVVGVMWQKRKHIKKKTVGLEYKMDKLEATFRNQCREEFAALQTAVSNLTSDLEGGNVLFRDYDVYACKTLFTSRNSDALMSPPESVTEQSQQAMETFKGLLRNRQFLLMLIQTFEKQNSFTIQDRSKVATILMVLNHDNMEYITGILTILLNALIDKTIASGTPKLLLRRSECVAEKLLTHWLSVCLYHYLKERSGSALYILYKAIKIQTEKGPIDYITNCGKYTLSEDKLFTSANTEINPVTLTLEVRHFDYIDNKEKQIYVQVLDCDTITQAKNKMLEILYKNVPYSQRPAVHSTCLEIEEGDGGTRRVLNDEDESSVKEGLWKRINTLQHYSVLDGTKVNLYLNKDMEASCSLLTESAPGSFIIGSFRRSKPIVRTISGSNFWHLTKKHQTADEVQLASDLFLPRLLNTKGNLQTYIDDLFQAVLSVGEEPPIIVKYLFDFLDSAASRCSIADPDVLHTWKCNSLLLRFWVNIIKNPEFVFDIHKPYLVDSCLSVVAQTLMDSCSTADLVLGPSSPSNKLLFAKDINRYKTMVRQYFQEMKQKPAVSDQELNSYLTEKVSKKYSGKFYESTALMEIYEYTARYRNKICNEMDNLEASSPGSFSPLTSKLQYVFMCMDMYSK